jgi:hypothetical protein
VPNRVTGRLPQREFTQEQELMGASSWGVGYCDFVCRKPDHWVYAGTGMKLNDAIPDLVGWEYHGMPIGSQGDLEILAQNKPIPNRFTDEDATDHVATLYSTSKGNFVFNAGTCFWSMLLSSPPGFKNPVCNLGRDGYRTLDFTNPDERVIQITRNLLNKAKAGQP